MLDGREIGSPCPTNIKECYANIKEVLGLFFGHAAACFLDNNRDPNTLYHSFYMR